MPGSVYQSITVLVLCSNSQSPTTRRLKEGDERSTSCRRGAEAIGDLEHLGAFAFGIVGLMRLRAFLIFLYIIIYHTLLKTRVKFFHYFVSLHASLNQIV